MLNPIVPLTLQFVSDGESTSLTVDLSLPPVSRDLRGAGALQVLQPVVSNGQGVSNPSVTASVSGTEVTFSFASAPVQSTSGVLVQYTLNFLLGYGS